MAAVSAFILQADGNREGPSTRDLRAEVFTQPRANLAVRLPCANDCSRAVSGSPSARSHASGVRRMQSPASSPKRWTQPGLGSFSAWAGVRYSHGLKAAGAGLAIIGYAVTLWSWASTVDVIGATVFWAGVALPIGSR